jgi:hypothetical protein
MFWGGPADASPLAPSAARGRSQRPPSQAWPSPARGRDARPNRADAAGESSLGYMRIEGELLKLGISVSATTIATVLRRSGLGPAPRRLGPSWSEFLRAQAYGLLGSELRSSVGAGREDDASVRTGPAPDGEARPVETDDTLSAVDADEPRLVSRPLARPRPLSAPAALRSLDDWRTECRRRSHRSHARDGRPRAAGARPQPTVLASAKPSPRRPTVRTNQLCLLPVGSRALHPHPFGAMDRPLPQLAA